MKKTDINVADVDEDEEKDNVDEVNENVDNDEG